MNKAVFTGISIILVVFLALAVIWGTTLGRHRLNLLLNSGQNQEQQEQQSGILEITEKSETRELTFEDGRTLLNISLSLPQIKGDSDAAANINQYYDGVYQKNLLRCEDELSADARELYQSAGDAFTPFNFSQSFIVKNNNEKYLSVVRSTDEYTGGVHGNYFISCDNFDPNTGAKLVMSDLFSVPQEQYADILFSQIEKQISEHNFDGYYENYKELLRDSFDFNDFFVSEGGITVVYQTYALAPYAAGEQYFTVPFAAFGDFLKPETAQLVSASELAAA